MNLETARALAYAHVNRRERTVQEVEDYLIRRGANAEIAALVVQELTDLGFLDDARFARLFAQDKRNLSGWGTGRIRRALRDRGIAPEAADRALADAGTAELERAMIVLQRRFPQAPATARERTRALGVLMRKGYDYELARDALAEHVRQAGAAVAQPRPQY